MPDNKCDFCGRYELLPFHCKYCGGSYCSSHRLPESHSCAGLSKLKESRFADPIPVKRTAYQPRRQPRKARSFKLPASGYYTYIIIGICIAVFILQLTLGTWFTSTFYLSWSDLLSQPWGLVSHMFLHGDFMHIFFNMLVLFFFGPVLERTVGSKKFLLTFFGSGILAGLVQVVLFPGSPVIGASGAIFGVLGALTILMPNLIIYLYFIPMKLVYAVLLFAVFDLIFLPTSDGIAHAAHLTGLLVGVIAGYWYKKKMEVPPVSWRT